MILSAADYLDDETILNKLPFISVDEIAEILARKDQEIDDQFEIEEEEEGEDIFAEDEDLALEEETGAAATDNTELENIISMLEGILEGL